VSRLDIGAPVGALLERLDGGRRQRRSWTGNRRAHIEVRGVHRPQFDDLARHVEKALEDLESVHWAQVNAVAGRVVVAFDPEGADLDDLVDVIEGVEEAHGAHEERFPNDRPEHPSDVEPLRRNAIALGADVLGLGVSVFGQVLRATPIPAEIANLVGIAEHEPRVRRFLEHHVGYPATDLGLALTSAFVQALSQGPAGLFVSIVHRAGLVAEVRSRQSVWERREPELFERRHDVPLKALEHEDRPIPLPQGPIERYADRASLASIGAFGVSLGLTRSPRRAANALIVGLPKAANMGREAFAAQFGRALGARDVLVIDPTVLRRLDRIDTVVLDLAVIGKDPLADAVAASARRQGHLVVGATTGGDDHRLDVELNVPGGRHLAASIRELQHEGRGVLLISAGNAHGALRAADCAIGLSGRGPQPPWGADLITGQDLESAWFVIEATGVASRTSSRSAAFSLAGSGIGALWSMLGPPRGAARRAVLPVNVAALASQGLASTEALALARRRAPVVRSRHDWHAMDPESVLEVVSSCSTGLDQDEAARRAPPRQKPSPLPVSFAKAVASELANPLTPVLSLGAGLAAAVGSASDAALVAGVMAANAVMSGAQRFRTELSLERLLRIDETFVGTRRGGEHTEVGRTELVHGDVVELETGDVVPADCRILESNGCEADESVLTGESLPVEKHSMATPDAVLAERSCMLYEGTTIVAGDALAVVVATGSSTEAGRALEGAPEPPPSGVEARLAKLTKITVPVTLGAGAAVSGFSLFRRRPLREAVSSGVSLMVAAVPEGLPLLASAAQLASARRLSERDALVRNPRTIEALGRVDVLCFDKTGTLTVGKIALQRVSDGITDESIEHLTSSSKAVLAAALRASPETDDDEVLPHATDQAVVEGAERAGISAGYGLGGWSQLGELAFEPARGFHAVVGKGPNGSLVTVKGAPEIILPRCDTWRSPNGIRKLDAKVGARLEAEVERMAANGLRVLAVAERSSSDRVELGVERVAGMELLGFLGLADHVRPTAAAAIDQLRRAGVDVVMITGDHRSTAQAIATELGITGGRRVLTGPDLDTLDDDELAALMPEVSVFARVTPTHKVRIVGAYQRAGRVVAMTGDGANDAPAIRLADAGIALGRRGAPAARLAADLVVTDDRIETIIDAIVEGRAMWASVRDALAILLGGNLGEVAFTLGATALSGTSPLNPRQFLLVNLMTDMLPALTIALRQPTERSPEALLHEGPEASLGSSLVRQIALRATTTAGGTGAAWLMARSTGSARRARTVALAALVETQLAQTALVGRTSPLVLASTAASAGALVAIVQTPGLSHFFGCTPMGPVGWGIATGASVAATGASVAIPFVVQHIRTTLA
jgi:cation-transporting P-type ATPase I